jgi:para-aminobenzoate synthetase component I
MQREREAIERMNHLGQARVPFLFLIDYEKKRPIILPLSEVNASTILYNIQGKTNDTNLEQRGVNLKKKVQFQRFPMSFVAYQQKFDALLQEINFGNTFLANLTCSTPIACNLTLAEIYWHSQAKYKFWLKDEFVCFSPEPFIQIQDGQVATFPMKGTIDASLKNAAHLLLHDPKETAEHHTIVDFLRNDLNRVAKKVKVEKFRFLDTLTTNDKTLLQMSSKIVGELQGDYLSRLGDILFALLPAGSICGAPKVKTVQLLQEIEGIERHFYTGIGGIFDGNTLDSGVLIRFIQQTPQGLVYKSGGGITTFSQAQSEYEEMIAKVYLPT